MAEGFIRVEKLQYTYDQDSNRPIEALKGIDLEISRGERVAIVGHNGSGKSTLAKCLNGILLPTSGDVWVNGSNTKQGEALLEIRATVGMVFQNPENQFVASTVEEEIAFGPENLGLARETLRDRVAQALHDTRLGALRQSNPRLLSAGQKGKLAIASILAMQPSCLIMDESTAMLDPVSRGEVLALLTELHEDGLTIVALTHYMEEAAICDRVVALERGVIVAQGTPRELFAHEALLGRLGLALPPAATIARGLARRGLDLGAAVLTPDELVEALGALAAVGA